MGETQSSVSSSDAYSVDYISEDYATSQGGVDMDNRQIHLLIANLTPYTMEFIAQDTDDGYVLQEPTDTIPPNTYGSTMYARYDAVSLVGSTGYVGYTLVDQKGTWLMKFLCGARKPYAGCQPCTYGAGFWEVGTYCDDPWGTSLVKASQDTWTSERPDPSDSSKIWTVSGDVIVDDISLYQVQLVVSLEG